MSYFANSEITIIGNSDSGFIYLVKIYIYSIFIENKCDKETLFKTSIMSLPQGPPVIIPIQEHTHR